MTQAEQIIKHAVTTGQKINWSFEDKNTVKVGDKTWHRVRTSLFWKALHSSKLFNIKNHRWSVPSTDYRKGYSGCSGYATLIK